VAPDSMTIRLHLRRLRVLEVLSDAVERLVVAVRDSRRVVRCPHCGFLTAKVHETRRVEVADLPYGGRPTTLVWHRRRFTCANCTERHTESHPEIAGKVTRRLARQVVRDAQVMTIKAISHRYGISWWLAMRTVRDWAELLEAERRRRRCKVLLIDETSLRRGHRYVTVLSNGETGEVLGMVRHRDARALGAFLSAQGRRWCRGVQVAVTDGSLSYRSAIHRHLPGATHVVDRFHAVRWFCAGLIEVRRRLQRLGPKGTNPAFDPQVFRSRYLQLRRLDRLEGEAIERLGAILWRYPELEVAWRMVQHLHGIYLAEDAEGANEALGAFVELWEEERFPEFDQVVSALLNWGEEIFAFHDTDRVTNGHLEGRMNKIGVLKRTAYGFRNVRNLAARTILISPAVA